MMPSSTRRRARKSQTRVLTIVRGVFPWIAVLFVGGLSLYAIFFSNYFVIDRVDVSVEGSLDPTAVRAVLFEQMDKPRFRFFSQKNFFLFRDGSARSILEDRFSVQSLKIRKRFPNQLQVTLVGSPFRAVWVSGSTAWDVTARGRIQTIIDPYVIRGFPRQLLASTSTLSHMASTSSPAVPDMSIIVDESSSLPADGAEVLDAPSLSFIVSASQLLKENHIRVLYFKTQPRSFDVRAVTKQGWEILMTNRERADAQVSNLMTVLDEQIKKKRKDLSLVDVRFEQRIYYTFK